MLATAIENEVAEYVERHAAVRDGGGRRLVVRNGRLPARQIQTGLGLVEVQQPRVNDRRINEKGERMRFSSAILPPYLRRTKSLEELIPWLYRLCHKDFSCTPDERRRIVVSTRRLD